MTDDQLRMVVVLSWAATTLMGFVVLIVVRQRDNILRQFWDSQEGYKAACESNRELIQIIKKAQEEEKDDADWWKEGK